jgi:outer membrane protein assembly factor BamE (lipoprotein component of BamABCDE complex)
MLAHIEAGPSRRKRRRPWKGSNMHSAVLKVATAVMGVALLSGCAGIREHRGYVFDEELATAVQVGVDNKESVERTLGRPTFTGQFDPNDWYFVGRDTSAFAFRRPRVTDQKVLHVRFDQAGNVASVRESDETQIASIHPTGRTTPTLGRKRSFFEELFGNIGTVGAGGLGGQQPEGQ